MPKRKPKYRGIENPAAHKADMERRGSSAASPHETRAKRLRTRETILRHEMRDTE